MMRDGTSGDHGFHNFKFTPSVNWFVDVNDPGAINDVQ
jgi:hypothetical protein